MAFLIGGANSAADTAFSVANSCRFDDGSSAYMHKTPGGAGNQRKFTFSTWFKLGNSTANLTLFATGADSTGVGNLTADNGNMGGSSSTGFGYVHGGYPSYITRIDKFSFTTDGNAVDIANLNLGRDNNDGTQN